MRDYRRLWIGLVLLALASPIGLYIPEIMRAGSAWGEWGVDEIKQMIGYAPAGMERHAEVWKAPIPDYALPGQEQAPLPRRGLTYVLSGLLGAAACGGGGYLLTRWMTGNRGRRRT
jgi:cobalt/nickel transport protein